MLFKIILRMNILLHPTYFPSISQYTALLQAETITFEKEDNFQKQTNRNRIFIVRMAFKC